MLTRHLQENPIIERSQSSQVTNDIEREELRNALISGLFLFLKMLRFHEIFATLMLQYFTRNIKHFTRFRLQLLLLFLTFSPRKCGSTNSFRGRII